MLLLTVIWIRPGTFRDRVSSVFLEKMSNRCKYQLSSISTIVLPNPLHKRCRVNTALYCCRTGELAGKWRGKAEQSSIGCNLNCRSDGRPTTAEMSMLPSNVSLYKSLLYTPNRAYNGRTSISRWIIQCSLAKYVPVDIVESYFPFTSQTPSYG